MLSRLARARGQWHYSRAMELGWGVVAAVLCGALLHAGWNALVKSSADKALDGGPVQNGLDQATVMVSLTPATS